jgi:alkaline phosphatase D
MNFNLNFVRYRILLTGVGFLYFLNILPVLEAAGQAAPDFPAGNATLYCTEVDSVLRKRSEQPFVFGVASGDPSTREVWIWTALNPYAPGLQGAGNPASDQEVGCTWEIATDSLFQKVVRQGSASTNAGIAYTIKVKVDELPEATRLYYRFVWNGKISPTGRTRTFGAAMNQIALGVASCSNLEWGYFNAYRTLAQMDEVDAVLHLGDYIYEYEPNRYGKKDFVRKNWPAREIISLQDYRSRYAQYHLDADLQEMRRRHPLITIWDDHEIANDAHVTGAQNHQDSTEGPSELRKKAALQAYFEALPVADHPGFRIRRSLSLGPLADLCLLDGRLEGRSPQVRNGQDSLRQDSLRTMLGEAQRTWLTEQIRKSKARWKLIGNQVIFSAYDYPPQMTRYSKSMDMWEGYPVERGLLLDTWARDKERNLVVLTGDVHATFAMDLRQNHRDAATALGVEWVTPSITSASLDEYQPRYKVRIIEHWFKKGGLNPHLRYLNFRDHGFMVVRLTQDEARCTWYYEKNILKSHPKTAKTVTRTQRHQP